MVWSSALVAKSSATEEANPIQLVFTGETLPKEVTRSIYLAGPTARFDPDNPPDNAANGQKDALWRYEAIRLFESFGYEGVLFIPEYNPDNPEAHKIDYQDQFGWELEAMNMADVIVFFVPRNLKTLPAFTTNVEFGYWVRSGKVVFGDTPDAEKNSYLMNLLVHEKAGQTHNSLHSTIHKAVEKTKEGVLRTGGGRWIPLHLWRTALFQGWYGALKEAGNRLDDARVLWEYRVGKDKEIVFAFVLQVSIWVEAEQRHKDNEFIFSRPDGSCVVLFEDLCRHEATVEDLLDIECVLVREFRSPARTHDGMIREVPGGGNVRGDALFSELAVKELKEETGLQIDPKRLLPLEKRQNGGTISTHVVHAFGVALTVQEMGYVRNQIEKGVSFGVATDTERTYLEVKTLNEMIEDQDVDWTNLGMIFTALTSYYG